MNTTITPLRVIGVALLIMGCSCHGSPAQTRARTDRWVEYKAPSGFDVEIPQGWAAEGTKEGHVLIHSSDRSEFVATQPFKAQDGRSSVAWMDSLIRQRKALFPEADFLRNDKVSAKPDEAIAKLTYRVNGKIGQANVLCHIADGAGMLYAIAAPRDLFEAKKPILMRILRSFHYTEAAEAAAPRAAAAQGPITYIAWKDPQEGAFTTEVPRGWKVTGGMFRYAPMDLRPQVNAGSPDGAIRMQFGDADLTTFAPPGPSSQTRGLREGQSYSVNGVPYTVQRYIDGARFSRLYVQAKIAKLHPGLTPGETKDRPDVVEQANRKNARNGIETRSTAGETQFTYPENGKTIHGLCVATTDLWGSGLGATWHASPNVVTAPAEKMPLAQEVMKHMIEHTAADPQWSAQIERTTQEFSQMVLHNHEQAMLRLKETYEKFTRQLAENQRQWSNVINNQVDVRNKATGETFKAAAGHNYYRQEGGTIVGTDTATAADINVTRLEQF